MIGNRRGPKHMSLVGKLLGLLPVLAVVMLLVATFGNAGTASAGEPYTRALTATLADGTVVTVEASTDAIPEGTTLEAKAVQNDAITEAVTAAARADGTELTSVKAYDVTLRDAAGNELEPSAAVKVTFSNTDLGSDNVSVYHVTAPDGDEATASDASELTVKSVDTQKAEADEQVFTTDHFSVYAVGTDTNRLIVRFHQWDSTTTVDYKIKKGDNLTKSVPDPGAGNLGTNQVFRGWVTSSTYDETTTLLTIEDVRTALKGQLPPTADGTMVDYYPAVFNAYTVTYQDQEGKVTLAQDTVFGVPGQNVSYTVKEISYDPARQNQRFDGWAAANKTYKSGHTIENLTSNVTLKASVSTGYWITYNSNGAGASHVAPAFYTSGNAPEKLPVPSRAGNNFRGWYKDAACTEGNEYTGGAALTENTTLYAKWEPVTEANYTIVYWQQNTSGNGYDYKASETASGTPTYPVDISAKTRDKYLEPGFDFKSIEPANATINDDGSTVVNVYYDRNEYTLTFKTKATQIWNAVSVYQDGISYYSRNYLYDENVNAYLQKVDGSWGYYTGYYPNYTWHAVDNSEIYVDGVTENSDGTPTYDGHVLQRANGEWGYYSHIPAATTTITALYGAPIYERFTKSPLSDFDWTLKSDGSEPWLAFLQTMPAENRTYYSHRWSGGDAYRMNYYMENLPNTTTGVSHYYDGTTKYFTKTLHPYWMADDMESTKDEDFVDFEGFEQWTSDPPFGDSSSVDFKYDSSTGEYKIDFYYARKQYDVVYQDGLYVDATGTEQNESSKGILDTKTGVYYEQSLSDYNKYAPTHPGYVFEGWYTDPTCTKPADESVFAASSTMPAHNVTVYAKWVKVQYEVEFHHNGGTLPDAYKKPVIVNNGDTVAEPKNFDQTRTGYELVGWYTDEACTKPFNFDSAISADTASALNMTVPYANEKYPYVQGKVNLYAKWRKHLTDAEGVTVVYDAVAGTIKNETTYKDPALYQTDANVIAAGAATPTDQTKNFQYWVLQTWDASANDRHGAFVDTDTHVYPGSSFNVASVTAHEFKDDNKAQAIVQLRAEYGDKLPMTTVVFNPNGGKFSGSTDAWSQDYNINDDIALPGDDGSCVPAEPERDGYEFVGWATTAPAETATDEQILAAVEIQPKESRGTQTYRADNLTGVAKEQLEGTTNTLYACWKPKYVTLTIQKELVGAQADLTKGYTIQVTGADGSIQDLTASTKALYDRSGERGAGGTDVVDALVKGTTTIKLKRGDKVTIAETTEHAGYDMTYAVTNGTKNDDGSITLNPTGQVDNGKMVYNTTVVVTNTKKDTPVTAVTTADAPKVLGVLAIAGLAIAGGFALVQRNTLQAASAGAHSAGHRATKRTDSNGNSRHMRGNGRRW